MVSIITMSSCKKDYLTLTPTTLLSPEAALSSETDLSTALLGAYAGVRNIEHQGRTLPVLGDLMSDNAYVSSQNSGRYTNFNNYLFTVTDGNVLGFWSAVYNTILRCNNIINAVVPTSVNVKQYKGEALAIRAMCYFDLVRYFGKPYTDDPTSLGVPIITKFDFALLPPRNKVSEVYTLINADLTQAVSLMTIFNNSTQFSKFSARGLQAKVYLTMGDKANAKTAALDVINNSGFTAVAAADYGTYWINALPRTDKVETLFEVSSDAINNNGFDGLANIYSQAGYGDMICSDELYALFTPADVRIGLYQPGVRINPAIFINKYPNVYGTDISDTKILRLSDVYLIAAEASLPSNETDALLYSNFVTSHRGADPITSTGAALFEDIITERRKELAFEGDRYFDLNRLKRPVMRSVNYPPTARTINYTDFRRILPIPQVELDANENIRGQQNPGWK